MDTGRGLERANQFGPQAISIIASVTAGLSSIVAAQLTTRFPLSFHASTPRWKYTVLPVAGYLVVYVGLLAYGWIRYDRLSGTLAFMSAPGVPLHGFFWALIPQTRPAPDPPSTDNYLLQCFRRKPAVLLMLTWMPLILGTVLAGVRSAWQALAVQVAIAVIFLATGRTPEMVVRARENAFGRAGRYMLIARPGMRDDTIAYTVDLQQERMLEPVRMSMGGIAAYQIVSELKCGRLGPIEDNESISERPVATYLDTFVAKFALERLRDMTGRLWRTLESCKAGVNEPVMDIFLLYGLVERMAYVAYRPTVCTPEERGVATRLNFSVCRTDCTQIRSEFRERAVALWAEWRAAGEETVRGEYWAAAAARQPNPVDCELPGADTLLQQLEDGDSGAETAVVSLGAVVSFVRYVLGHDEQLATTIVRNVPYYHNRIRKDVSKGAGNIPLVCRGIISSMKGNAMVAEHVDGHEWASSGDILRWGPGGYALLDQAYARNSAIAYVGQLAIIVVKAVLEN